MFTFSKSSYTNMFGIHQDLKLVMCESIKVTPIDFGIPRDGGVRTAARQNQMFHDPTIKTNCDGFDKISNHQIQNGQKSGKAVDVFAFVEGKASWKHHHLSMIAGVIMSTADRLRQGGEISIRIRWGGQFGSRNFNGWDKPHFEVML